MTNIVNRLFERRILNISLLEFLFILFSFFSLNFIFNNLLTDDGGLPNLLMVGTQISSLFFFRSNNDIRKRSLCFFIFLFCAINSIFLEGAPLSIIFWVSWVPIIFIILFPLEEGDAAFYSLFFLFMTSNSLLEWGFFLLIQLIGYHLLALLFLGSNIKFYRILMSLTSILIFFYTLLNNNNVILNPLKTAFFLSGSCIFYAVSSHQLTLSNYSFIFFIYQILSIFIGLFLEPSDCEKIGYFPKGVLVFIYINLCFIAFIYIYRKTVFPIMQSFLPFYCAFIFAVLPSFPLLGPYVKLFEGANLVLLFLGLVITLFEEKNEKKGH